MKPDPYWDALAVHREVLLWAEASRMQLDRWEPLVAAHVAGTLRRASATAQPGRLLWQAQMEHHFALIAANHMLSAVKIFGGAVDVDPVLAKEIRESRDLHEHWVENMPVFRATPRPRKPSHRSGRSFAERNPSEGPFWWMHWNSVRGPMLTPNVSSADLHGLLVRVHASISAVRHDLADYTLPGVAVSPWTDDPDSNGWWPRPDAS